MDSRLIWQAFLDTGAPEMYLLYSAAKRKEETGVLDNDGTCSQSHGIQG